MSRQNITDIPELYEAIKPIATTVRTLLAETQTKIEVDPSTLYKWGNQYNQRGPNPYKLLAMLRYHSKKEIFSEVLAGYPEVICNYLENSFKASKNERPLFTQDCHLQDKYDAYIYFICGTKRKIKKSELTNSIGNVMARNSGLSLDKITEEFISNFSEEANERIDILLKKELLSIDSEQNLTRMQKDLNTNTERYYNLLLSINKDFIQKENFYSKKNAHYLLQESIPSDLAQEISTEIKEFALYINKKISDNASSDHDAVPYYVSLSGEKLLFEHDSTVRGN